jgi:beta-phosphoglucomutase family hydrolase
MNMLQAVIFDFDGVIVDSHPAHLQAWRSFFQSIGITVSDEELLFVTEGAKRGDILRHFLGDLSQAQVKQYGERKESLLQDSSPLIGTVPGVTDLLNSLSAAGVPMAVASSASRKRVRFTLESLQLKSYFQVIVAGDEIEKGKPDPEIFQVAAKKLEVDPARTLVFEDSINGVLGAKRAGMKCLCIGANGRHRTLMEAGADWVFTDFTAVSMRDLQRFFLTGESLAG